MSPAAVPQPFSQSNFAERNHAASGLALRIMNNPASAPLRYFFAGLAATSLHLLRVRSAATRVTIMCGIVGYVGRAHATPILLDGLRRLEYRGYDSAGISVVERGNLETRKCAGRIAALTKRVRKEPVSGSLGTSHTRWATHGKVNDENAPPHFDASGKLALVHNGVIENYQALKDELVRNGDTTFRSETDTEVLAHLIGKLYDDSFASTVDASGKKARLFDA